VITMTRFSVVFLVLAGVLCVLGWLVLPEQESTQEWQQRKGLFRDVALRARPLVAAVESYNSAAGRPPGAVTDLVPQYLEKLPETGLQDCGGFEYRSLAHRQSQLVWYDLGSRQGQPLSKPGQYSDGDPDHAILVFTLDAEDKITSALVDRIPKGLEPGEFSPEQWNAEDNRIEMALALAETYRLYGMPRPVFEELLGAPDGSRLVDQAPWELRINCSRGLLNSDALIYWPNGRYPEHLYGGRTESVGTWVYVHHQGRRPGN